MAEPVWIEKRTLMLLQPESLADHGGLTGIRDEALLDSALMRPRNLLAYEPEADVPALAAAYGYGLARNHPFVDGNKRMAFLSIGLFLALNGCRLCVDPVEATRAIVALAAGSLSEQELAEWIRNNVRPSGENQGR
jgi:death on curing protein